MLVTLLNMPEPGICAMAAAICTDSQNPQKSLEAAIDSGHESVLEHCVFSFRIDGVSRALLAQLTRHRFFSFSVLSQRYCNQSKRGFRVPPSILKNPEAFRVFMRAMDGSLAAYDELKKLDIPSEDARYALSQGITTSLICTANARELRRFFELRCCNKAQWEIRELADDMLRKCQRSAPELFKKAGSPCMRGEKCPEKRPCGEPRKAAEV